MDVLTRNHSISKAIRRQTLVQNFSPLQVSYDCGPLSNLNANDLSRYG